MRTIERKGRLWVETGEEPYIRKDGKATTLIVWSCRCAAEGCEASVDVKTPATGYETSKAFEAKHCPAHKLTKAQVTERWQQAIKASREK